MSRSKNMTKESRDELITAALVCILIVGGIVAIAYAGGWRPGSGGGAILVSEDFNSGSLSSWTQLTGTWSIVGGELYVSAANATRPMIVLNTLVPADCEISFNVRVTIPSPSTGSPEAQAFWRYTSSTSDYYGGMGCYGAKAAIGIRNATGSFLLSGGGNHTELTIGQSYTELIIIKGSAFSVHINGIQICSASDTTWPVGQIGLTVYSSTAYFDNFVVRAVA